MERGDSAQSFASSLARYLHLTSLTTVENKYFCQILILENMFSNASSPLSAAAKTLEEVREWLEGGTRWPLWSATGRTPSPMLSGQAGYICIRISSVFVFVTH